jgi:hypothetical protein
MGRSRGRRWSRREFLTLSGGGIVAVAAGPLTPAGAQSPATGATEAAGAPSVAPSPRSAFLSASQRVTLGAAVARIVPASGPGDWSAADLGVVDYIDNLLAGFDRDPAAGGIYPGGPYRTASAGGNGFSTFQILSEAKAIGWRQQVVTWRSLYTQGLVELDTLAGGDFASEPTDAQELILYSLDYEASPFFTALFDHTMEGTYSHPVYGGNQGYRAWQWLGFGGDVHGVRFPHTGSLGSWNTYGGYAPEEIAGPGTPSTQQPVVTGPSTVRW